MQHSFDTEIATKYGVIEAVLIDHLAFWIRKNKANKKHAIDGRYWTYNSMRAYADLFPYLNSRQVRYALEKLQKEGVIITGNHNKNPYDRTKWYAFTDDGMRIIDEDFSADATDENENCICQNEKIHLTKLSNETDENGKPIPDTIPFREPNKETGIYSSSCARACERIVNESSDDDEKPIDLFELWNKNISPLTSLIAQDIQDMVKDFGEDAVRFGIETACRNGVRKSAYVQSCARNYLSGGPQKQQTKKGNPKNDVVKGVEGALKILEGGVF